MCKPPSHQYSQHTWWCREGLAINPTTENLTHRQHHLTGLDNIDHFINHAIKKDIAMTSWSAPATCSYTQVILGVTDVHGDYKYAVPLTTIFRPPPGCRFPLEELAAPKCWPPSRENVWDEGGFYSPGLCPSEYTVGCTVTAGEKLNGVFIRANETAGICVPR